MIRYYFNKLVKIKFKESKTEKKFSKILKDSYILNYNYA